MPEKGPAVKPAQKPLPKDKPDFTTVAERMTVNVPVAAPEQTIADVEKILTEKSPDFDSIAYVYVVRNDKLVGVVSVHEVFRAPKDARLEKIMRPPDVTVHEGTHQERAAMLAVRHNLKAVPVVDKDGRFLGAVPADAILNILHEEHVEDALRAAGVHGFKNAAEELIGAPALVHFRRRLPWLVIGLAGGMVAAAVVHLFEATLQGAVVLAAFIPAIVYIADAVGSQTQTIYIRSIVLEPKLNMRAYARRELAVGVLIGIALSLLAAVAAFAFWREPRLLIVLPVSFFAAILAAMGVALFLPWLSTRLKFDPAIVAGPAATVIRDIVSLSIYLGVASVVF